MTNELVPQQPPQPIAWPIGIDAARVMRAFEANKSRHTLEGYGRALRYFAKWLNVPDAQSCVSVLVGKGPGPANALIFDYVDVLRKDYAPDSVNFHLAAIKHLVKICNVLGVVTWQLQVPSLPVTALRDTRGCGLDGWQKLVEAAKKDADELRRLRNVAMLHVLFDCALRREEVLTLDLEHWDRKRPALYVKGKKQLQRQWFTTPEPTANALDEYVKVRGNEPGPLFRLSYKGIYKVVVTLAKRAGIKAWPHAVRHAAITHGLDVTGGDIRAVQRFARHANPSTTMRYDDNRRDLAGEVARKISEDDDAGNTE